MNWYHEQAPSSQLGPRSPDEVYCQAGLLHSCPVPRAGCIRCSEPAARRTVARVWRLPTSLSCKVDTVDYRCMPSTILWQRFDFLYQKCSASRLTPVVLLSTEPWKAETCVWLRVGPGSLGVFGLCCNIPCSRTQTETVWLRIVGCACLWQRRIIGPASLCSLSAVSFVFGVLNLMPAAAHGKASGRARGRLPWLGRPATTGREPQPRMPCCCRQCVHVAWCSRSATKLESFSFFSLSDLVTLFRMGGECLLADRRSSVSNPWMPMGRLGAPSASTQIRA